MGNGESSPANGMSNDLFGGERHPNPRVLLGKIELFTEEVGTAFKSIIGSLEQLQGDIAQLDQLKQVALVAEQMLSGSHESHIDVEAKGEVGKLVGAINKTLENLQALDRTVHRETGKVPELAAHLDHITVETESATQQVLEKLDEMIAGSEEQSESLSSLKDMSKKRVEMDRENLTAIQDFLKRLEFEEDHTVVLQEAVEFVALMGTHSEQQLRKTEEVDRAIDAAATHSDNLMNHAFDIMNILQFQDITRQKVSKVIGLLKDMQSGLYRLLDIFNIRANLENRFELDEKHKATQDRIFERDALTPHTDNVGVEEIIRNAQKAQES